nr:hypothetical protein [Tanacetum cinerariifolium]
MSTIHRYQHYDPQSKLLQKIKKEQNRNREQGQKRLGLHFEESARKVTKELKRCKETISRLSSYIIRLHT